MQFYFVTISISIVLIDISIARIYYNHQARSVLNFIQHEYSPDHLSIVSFDENDRNVQKIIRHLLSPKTLSKWDHYNLVSFSMPKVKAIHNGVKQTLTNIIAIMSSANKNTWNKYLDLMAMTDVGSSVLLVVGNLERNDIQNLEEMLHKHSVNKMFYLVYQTELDPRKTVWYQVTSLNNYTYSIINQLELDSNEMPIKHYDMQGLEIVSITLSWAPYFTLVRCKEDMTNCGGEGYLADVMDILGDMMNFKWESDGEINENWGTTAISGPSNSSGVWGGVVGNVFNGTYQLSIRYTCLNFVTISPQHNLCNYLSYEINITIFFVF